MLVGEQRKCIIIFFRINMNIEPVVLSPSYAMSSPVCKLTGHHKLEIPNETGAGPLKVAASTGNVAT
jgi:hypothetical protein